MTDFQIGTLIAFAIVGFAAGYALSGVRHLEERVSKLESRR